MVDHARRTLLQSAALLPMAAKIAEASSTLSPSPIVDCHIHCFDGSASTRFPYHAHAPYRPEKALPPEQALACMNGAKVDFGVFVHPETYQEDHRWFDHCLDVANANAKKPRWKGTCLLFADRPGWKDELGRLHKRGNLSAFRVHAYAPERLPPFGPQLRALWKAGVDLGLIAQIHFEPHYAAGFTPLIEEFAKTPVVIDNLGRPLMATAEEWKTVLGWARFPNVIIKLSALPNPDEYPFRPVKPFIDQILAAFGPARVIWGGTFGYGATPASYAAGREAIRSHFADLPATAQAAILGGTAARLFGFV
jgi:predicted TIM-barrel fold metal-dependent hydrolase